MEVPFVIRLVGLGFVVVLLVLVLIRAVVKMRLKMDLSHRPTPISSTVVATIITVSRFLSLRATRGQGRRALPTPAEPPFRVATEAEDAVLEPVWPRRRKETATPHRDAHRHDPEHAHHEGDLR